MKKQLQYTTAFVVILLAILLGTLYTINTSPAFDGQPNQLTAATTATDYIVDCNKPLPDDATEEYIEEYNEMCS
ncbi:hypothetical protein COV16_02500 [Candidatus Woesearchaeota archaeon CG10_big_fil_rev_8_21_14_0_10_34_8]|nr:MAG: hypothetical protein COV16_02500 [Candidatus Woesearchaeota archaeon CG10_big_fil_rev_8_21_14_0_10_34_8]